jgi:hypothetical protein
MQAHVRNDVKPSVGQVVISDWLEYAVVSSISVDVIKSVTLGCDKVSFDIL